MSTLLLKIFIILWGSLFGGIPFAFMVVPSIIQDSIYVITYIIGVLCIIAMGIVFKRFKKRTRYGNELLGKILGFKEFLEKVEKEKLEEQQKDHQDLLKALKEALKDEVKDVILSKRLVD